MMKHHRLDHVCDINLYTSKGDGNWITTVSIGRLTTRDINLYTSRGDGNSMFESPCGLLGSLDTNLYTSRGDGNLQSSLNRSTILRYKPIYLERGRKLEFLPISVCELYFDINLYTSRGDFFENFENSLDTASRKC